MRAVRSYRAPGGALLAVDAALPVDVLDRLNALPFVRVCETCAGHARGPERRARVSLSPRPGLHWSSAFERYLERLSATEYRACVSRYRSNGGPPRWRMEVRGERDGEAPRRWWVGLADILDEEGASG